ncbi:MAG: ERF family protein [Clostridium sp.]|nr:ERF family protein [Clostridium sp.]
MKEINIKLMNIQQELKAPKGQYNDFGKYAYRSCEDILEAVKPLLKKEKVVLTISDELQYIGNRYYIKATATLIDTESEATISNSAYAREEETKKGMDGSQITGASSSYARKYALNGLFGIDDNKDSDTTNIQNKEEKEDKKISPKQMELIQKYYQGENLAKLLEVNNLEKLEDMSINKASEILSKLFAKKEDN